MKRRRYIVDSRLQFKYVGLVVSFALISAFLAGYSVFSAGWGMMGEKLANVYPQGHLMAIFRAVNLTLARNIMLLLPFIVVISVLFSHRMAGPIIRIERVLDEIANGNFDVNVTLRKKDELKRVAEAINKMRAGLKENKQKQNLLLGEVSKGLVSLEQLVLGEELDKGKIREQVLAINLALSQLKS